MNWKNRLTNYNFWVAIVSAIILILQALKIDFDFAYVNEIVTAVLGLLVVIGIINDPTKSSSSSTKTKTKKDSEPATENKNTQEKFENAENLTKNEENLKENNQNLENLENFSSNLQFVESENKEGENVEADISTETSNDNVVLPSEQEDAAVDGDIQNDISLPVLNETNENEDELDIDLNENLQPNNQISDEDDEIEEFIDEDNANKNFFNIVN